MKEIVVGFPFFSDRNDGGLDYVILEEVSKSFNGIMGKVKKNELPIESMKRIFKEKTGCSANEWKIACSICKKDNDSQITIFTIKLSKDQVNEIDYNLFVDKNLPFNLDFYSVSSVYENYRCMSEFFIFTIAHRCINRISFGNDFSRLIIEDNNKWKKKIWS